MCCIRAVQTFPRVYIATKVKKAQINIVLCKCIYWNYDEYIHRKDTDNVSEIICCNTPETDKNNCLPPVTQSLWACHSIRRQSGRWWGHWCHLLPSGHQDLLCTIGPGLLNCKQEKKILRLCSLTFIAMTPILATRLTWVMTPGLICMGWMGGAWVTRGTEASIRTE